MTGVLLLSQVSSGFSGSLHPRRSAHAVPDRSSGKRGNQNDFQTLMDLKLGSERNQTMSAGSLVCFCDGS